MSQCNKVFRRLANYYIKRLEKDNAPSDDSGQIRHAFSQSAKYAYWDEVFTLAQLTTRARDDGEGYFQVNGRWVDEGNVLDEAIGAVQEALANFQKTHVDLTFAKGELSFVSDDYDEAIATYKDVLELCRGIPKYCREKNIRYRSNMRIGEICFNQTKYDEALGCFEDELSNIYLFDPEAKLKLAEIHSWLGRVKARQKAFAEAKGHFQESIKYHKENGNTEGVVAGLIRLAELMFEQENTQEAKKYLRQAESEAERLELIPQARMQREIANQYKWKNMFTKAKRLYAHSLHIFDEHEFAGHNIRNEIAWTRQAYGECYYWESQQKDIDKQTVHALLNKAEELLEVARKEFSEQFEIRHSEGYARNYLGKIYFARNDLYTALTHSNEGLRIFRESGMREAEAYLHTDVGDPLLRLNHHQKAKDHYAKALAIWQELDQADWIQTTTARILYADALNNKSDGRINEACNPLCEAAVIFRQFNHTSWVEEIEALLEKWQCPPCPNK